MQRALARACASLVLVASLAACKGAGRNPVLGEWELDRDQTRPGAVLAAEVTDLTEISLRRESIAAKDTEIPVSWIVEKGRVRAVRGDGRGEHAIEVLPEQRIRVELPIGVTAVYRRKGS